jgi:hypothetical protein
MIKYILSGFLIMHAAPTACVMIEQNRIKRDNAIIIEKCNEITKAKERVNCIMNEAKKEELRK